MLSKFNYRNIRISMFFHFEIETNLFVYKNGHDIKYVLNQI